jgi:Alkylmercury lyase
LQSPVDATARSATSGAMSSRRSIEPPMSCSARATPMMWSVAPAPLDRAVRHRVYVALAEGEGAPGASTLAKMLGVELATVHDALERLHAAHDLVLDAVTREVRMALPFSNIPTAYRVTSGSDSWNVNCAWDALALVRLLDLQEARVVDQGGQGRESRVLTVVGGDLVERDGVISLPRPAWRWWDDIVFT